MLISRFDDNSELRLLERHHASDLFGVIDQNREYLARWLGWVDGSRSSADVDAFIASALQQLARGAGIHCGIFVGGQVVGSVGCHEIDARNRKTSAGFWIAEHLQGRGLATLSVDALVRYAFLEWGLHRMEIRCALDNQRSRALALRLGFEEEGIRKQYEWATNGFRDLVVYAGFAPTWLYRKSN
jgi:ribosomal-protein-serine acetyltransferase